MDLSFFRALPASIWGHCSQVLVLTSIGAHKKARDNDTFRAVFPSIPVSWDPQALQNKAKNKMTNRPCLPPPPDGKSLSTPEMFTNFASCVSFTTTIQEKMHSYTELESPHLLRKMHRPSI